MSLGHATAGAGLAGGLLVALMAAAAGTACAQAAGAAPAAPPSPTATAVAAPPGPSVASTTATWPIAGQQGLVRFVIVPQGHATDRAAYAQQVRLLCEPQATCFLNFYTNSTGAPVELPLADAIDRESTAVFRRSAKQGAERFIWRCSLKVAEEACF